MKQRVKLIFVTKALVLLLLCSVFCMCSGSSSDSEPVNDLWLDCYPSWLTFSAELGESQNVEISTNGEWYIAGVPDWLYASKTGQSTITVTTKSDNEYSWDRAERIYIKAKKVSSFGSNEEETSINVTQSALENGEINASPLSLQFPSEGGADNSKIISVSSNTSWTVTSSQSWCTVSPSYGNGNGIVTVTVLENTSSSARSASITIKEGVSGKTVTVSVSQERGFTNSIGRDEYDADKKL